MKHVWTNKEIILLLENRNSVALYVLCDCYDHVKSIPTFPKLGHKKHQKVQQEILAWYKEKRNAFSEN